MSREFKQFPRPVTVRLSTGEEKRILALQDAARILLDQWPTDTERRRNAMKAILASLKEENPTAVARAAFIAAAVEARVLRSE